MYEATVISRIPGHCQVHHRGYARHSANAALEAAKWYVPALAGAKVLVTKLRRVGAAHCSACGQRRPHEALAPVNGRASDWLLCDACGPRGGLEEADYPSLMAPCLQCQETFALADLESGFCPGCTGAAAFDGLDECEVGW